MKRASHVKPFALAATSVLAAPALLAIASVIVVVGALVGWEPFWSEPHLNLAEAAALNDRGTIQRLIASGADPNALAPVRPPILKSHAQTRCGRSGGSVIATRNIWSVSCATTS